MLFEGIAGLLLGRGGGIRPGRRKGSSARPGALLLKPSEESLVGPSGAHGCGSQCHLRFRRRRISLRH
jgi:hypothetical protein